LGDTAFGRLARWITFTTLADGFGGGDLGTEAGTAKLVLLSESTSMLGSFSRVLGTKSYLRN